MSKAISFGAKRVDQWRELRLSQLTVSFQGEEYQADLKSAQTLLLFVCGMPDTFSGIHWRTADNKMVLLTPTQLFSLFAAMQTAIEEVYSRAFAAKEMIATLPDLDSILDYVRRLE